MAGSSKAANVRPVLYCDSNVFLAFFNGEPGRTDVISTILTEARRGEVELVTSTLSVVESNHVAIEKANRRLDEAVEERLRSFWNEAPLQLVELSGAIAWRAFEVARASVGRGRSLPVAKSPDAIHLATALWVGVDEFLSYDAKLLSVARSHKLLANEPEARSLVFPSDNEPRT